MKKIIDFYGKEAQCRLAMEECAELIQAINKCLCFEGDGESRNNLIEEIADVEIMIEQLKIMFNITNEEHDKMYDKKLKRVYGRLEASIEAKKDEEEENDSDKIKLTKFEYYFLEGLCYEYKNHDLWFCRDGDKKLFLCLEKPYKDYLELWYVDKEDNKIPLVSVEDKFKFIDWNYDGAYSVKELLENCEVIE
jgi:NTP pyrophosphatase (non-canonical NTP hydrolase)